MYEAMIKSDKIHTDCIPFLINAHERCADLINQKSPKVTGYRRQQVIASILGDHWQLIFRGVARRCPPEDSETSMHPSTLLT